MKIVTCNVNGLRSALSKGLTDWIAAERPDILCLQETKIQQGRPSNWKRWDTVAISSRPSKKGTAAWRS